MVVTTGSKVSRSMQVTVGLESCQLRSTAPAAPLVASNEFGSTATTLAAVMAAIAVAMAILEGALRYEYIGPTSCAALDPVAGGLHMPCLAAGTVVLGS